MTAARLTPPARTTLDEQIAATIIEAVLDGRLPVGEPLPAERELAEQLSVNRTSLRQALARLEQIGLVRSRQGSGTVVQDPTTLTDAAIVRQLANQIGPDLVGELIEVRSGLGALIGRLAARRADGDDLVALRAAFAEVAAATDATARLQADLTFFSVLITSARNRPLAGLIRWVESTYGVAPESFAAAFDDALAVTSGLNVVLDAVERGDEDAAARAVEAYFEASGHRLVAAATR
jgi:DNA-binding FadR family transcriptional regulator